MLKREVISRPRVMKKKKKKKREVDNLGTGQVQRHLLGTQVYTSCVEFKNGSSQDQILDLTVLAYFNQAGAEQPIGDARPHLASRNAGPRGP